MCVCVGGVVSVALQEETAVALCGLLSVPLTYKDGTVET